MARPSLVKAETSDCNLSWGRQIQQEVAHLSKMNREDNHHDQINVFWGEKKSQAKPDQNTSPPLKQQQWKQPIPLPLPPPKKKTSKHLLLACFTNFWLRSYQESFSGTKILIKQVSAVSLYQKHYLYAQFWLVLA